MLSSEDLIKHIKTDDLKTEDFNSGDLDYAPMCWEPKNVSVVMALHETYHGPDYGTLVPFFELYLYKL